MNESSFYCYGVCTLQGYPRTNASFSRYGLYKLVYWYTGMYVEALFLFAHPRIQ